MDERFLESPVGVAFDKVGPVFGVKIIKALEATVSGVTLLLTIGTIECQKRGFRRRDSSRTNPCNHESFPYLGL